MHSGNGVEFRVDRLPRVNQQIRELAEDAKSKGNKKKFLRVLRQIVEKLKQEPLNWGDPEFHPAAKGSTVFHRLIEGLYVRYVVYEIEHLVMILQMRVGPDLNQE